MKKILIAALLLGAPSAKGVETKVGATALDFLQIGAGARALGMGDAYTAVADGPESVYWNPAGLARMSRIEAQYTRTELPAGVHHDFIAAAVPSPLLLGTIAVAVTRLSQDSLDLVDASNQTLGAFRPTSEVFALAYAHQFSANDPGQESREYFKETWNLPHVDHPDVGDDEPWTGEIAAGLSMKAVHESLGTREGTSFAVDGGGLFRPAAMHELILGGAMRNFGSRIRFITDYETLPMEVAASVAYDARFEGWRLLPVFEVAAPYAGIPYAKLGVETAYDVSDGVQGAVRLGYSTRSAPTLGALAGLSAGVGVRAGRFSLDAAFQPMGYLGTNLRVGVGWKFGDKIGATKAKTPKKKASPSFRRR